jgi:hypothetical protein
MSGPMEPETMWRRLLSGRPDLIRTAWNALDAEGRKAVRRHLDARAVGEGWQAAQRNAARAALRCLERGPASGSAEEPDPSDSPRRRESKSAPGGKCGD